VGTCLDPGAPIPVSDLSGLGELINGYVYAYRTARSLHVGSTEYRSGQTYTAPVFSVDSDSPCHPGIYLAPRAWLDREYPREPIVRVRARVEDTLAVAGGKYRARQIEVL
jgi:hypothetical protein